MFEPCPAVRPHHDEIGLSLSRQLTDLNAGNPQKRMGLGVEAAAGQVLQGRVLPNPELAFQMQDTRANSRTTSVLLNQTLELGGERAARMAAAGSARDVAEALRATRQVELEARVSASFHALLAAQQGVHLAEQTIALAGAATTAATKRVRTGKIPPLEADKARVTEASARAALARAQSALANARQALAATWGEPDADFGDAVGDGAALPVVQLPRRAARVPPPPPRRRSGPARDSKGASPGR